MQKVVAYQLRQFIPNYEALGIVFDFVGGQAPFERFSVGRLLPALKHQVANKHHLCAFRGDTLVGYFGWLPISEEVGQHWLRGMGDLSPSGSDDPASAFALTIVRVDERAALYAMIEELRRRIPSGNSIFYSREYADPSRPAHRRRSAIT